MTALPPCPLCKKPALPKYKPFCCKRCADIDLARWFKGDYRIEGEVENNNNEETKEDE